jgi:BirA family biotin operon repressor/biotin-[acetyl-CoA-carboxylase] ligase
MSLPLDLAEALAHAAPRLGFFEGRVQHLPVVGSTNDEAERLAAAGAEEGTTVVADTQTAGRGRLGRSWFSAPGSGLYLSIVFRPPAPRGAAASPASLLTLTLGLAVAEALRAATGADVVIKWPNDLLLGGRKLGGILAEAFDLGSVGFHVVAGIGINLAGTTFPPEIAERVGSIESMLGCRIDRGLVLADVLASIAVRYRDLVEGRFGVILSRWQALAPSSRGTAVEWLRGDAVQRGVTAGIAADGALLVRTAGGLVRVVAGEVRWPS